MTREDQKFRGEKVRQSILDTALKIGLEEGFEALSVRKIIHRMNYSTGVVYHYFKDKQEILDAIEAAETERFYRQIREVLDDRKNLLNNLRTVFHLVFTLAYHEPEKYNLIVLHKFSNRSQSRPIWIEDLTRRLKEGADAGLIRALDFERVAFCVWSSFLGFHLVISGNRNLTLPEAEALFDTEFELILNGLRR